MFTPVRGDVDAIFAWQPYIYNAQERLGRNAVVISSEGIYNSPFNIVVLDRDLTAHAEALTKLLKGLKKTAEYMKSNRQDSVAIVAAKLSLDTRTVDAIWDGYSFTFGLRPYMLSLLKDEGSWAKRAGIVKVDAADPSYNSLISDAIEKRLP